MTNPVFPKMDKDMDSSLYAVEQEDKSLKTQMDGGYVVSRAKHTRKPRKTFKIGYTALLAPDKGRLMDFYDIVDCSLIFDWFDPPTQKTYQVRFAAPPAYNYKGIGYTQLWDVQLQLEQA